MMSPELPRLVGGHVALDLVNSVAPRLPDGGPAEEYLPTPAALLHWARRTGVLTAAEAAEAEAAWVASPGTAERDLRAVVEIREATYQVLLAATGTRAHPVDAALDRLLLRWNAALARGGLVLGGVRSAPGDGPAARIEVGRLAEWRLPDRLVDACVDLLRTMDVRQLGTCPLPDGGCGWLFLDQSRNHSRRWCTMEDCGAHAKARRLNERRRRRSATPKSAL
jgi:predicted RNA-binding Zn ribbon-like protein